MNFRIDGKALHQAHDLLIRQLSHFVFIVWPGKLSIIKALIERPEALAIPIKCLETCSSQKVKRLFVYMAEKAGHPWFKALKFDNIQLGTARYMVVPTGKYIAKYNMTIPKDLAEYE